MIINKILDLKRELIKNGMSGNIRIFLDSTYDLRIFENELQKEMRGSIRQIQTEGSSLYFDIDGIKFVAANPKFNVVYAKSESLDETMELKFEVSEKLACDLQLGLICCIRVYVKGYYFFEDKEQRNQSFAPPRTIPIRIFGAVKERNKFIVNLDESFFGKWFNGLPISNDNPEISANIFRDAFKDALLKYGE